MTKIAKPARQSGWEVALVEVLARHQQQPMAWGMSDCLTRIADVALAMTGVDPMSHLRGTYEDAKGATATLKASGYKDIAAALAAHFDEVAPAKARRGDCGVVEVAIGRRKEQAGVIVMGDMVMGCAAPAAKDQRDTGVTWAPRARLIKAYRIG